MDWWMDGGMATRSLIDSMAVAQIPGFVRLFGRPPAEPEDAQ